MRLKVGYVLSILVYTILTVTASASDLSYTALYVGSNVAEVYHSTIISEVTKNEIKYAAHTSERDYEPLSKHLKDDFVVIIRIRDDAIKGYTN